MFRLKKTIIGTMTLVCGLLILIDSPYAVAKQVITLKDGSVLKGRLKSVQDNVYTIETESLGEINLKEKDIVQITNENPHPASSFETSSGFQVFPSGGQYHSNLAPNLIGPFQTSSGLSYQQLFPLLMHPDLMQDLQKLMEDPGLQRLFTDELLLQDLLSQDPQRIQDNPKFQELLQNPQMQQMIQKLKQGFLPQGDLLKQLTPK